MWLPPPTPTTPPPPSAIFLYMNFQNTVALLLHREWHTTKYHDLEESWALAPTVASMWQCFEAHFTVVLPVATNFVLDTESLICFVYCWSHMVYKITYTVRRELRFSYVRCGDLVVSVPATRSIRPRFESRPGVSPQSGLRCGRSPCEYCTNK